MSKGIIYEKKTTQDNKITKTITKILYIRLNYRHKNIRSISNLSLDIKILCIFLRRLSYNPIMHKINKIVVVMNN